MTASIAQVLIQPRVILDHTTIIHKLADRSQGPGKLVIAGFGEDPSRLDPKTGKPGLKLPPKIIHVGVGDVDLTPKHIRQIADQPHCNVYMPFAVFRPDLPPGSKGTEKDVRACLAIIADFDDAEAVQWAERLPVEPQYVLETSAGRFQCFFLFRKPEPLDAVKQVAQRLKAIC
jgi:hypothetical protein